MSDVMTRQEADEMKTIVKSLRDRAEEIDKESADFKAYCEKADIELKKFDEKVEKLVAEVTHEKKEAEDLKKRLEHMELLQATASQSCNSDNGELKKETLQVMNAMMKSSVAWQDFIAKETNVLKAQRVFNSMTGYKYDNNDGAQKMASLIGRYEQKASTDLLRSDIGELGGYLCPPEYSSELAKNIIEKSPVRQFARVKQTGSKTYFQPVRVGIPVAERPGEAREGGKSVSNYIMEEWSPQRLTNTTPVSVDELLYNNYNIAGELLADNGLSFAVKEGQEFVYGTGVKEGLGFTVDPNVPEYETATSTLDFDDVIKVSGELKQGYNAMYFFNRRTLVYLRLLKDQNDRYLWAGPFGDSATGSPATINGIPYSAAFIDMDDYDVNDGYPILFADMGLFYLIVDRTDTTVIRDEITRAKEAIVEYTMRKYSFGKPWIKEAGIRIKKKSA